jgi:hypothetical protein
MDPYLEAPDIWPDFHDRIAAVMSAELNRTLPPPYYARLEARPEIGIAEEGETFRRIIPGVAVVRHDRAPAWVGGGALVASLPRVELSKSMDIEGFNEPIQHHFVEIRDPTHAHQLVTLIEIASPSNKQPGPDRASYQKKQQEVLNSDASLVEIDLLRRGKRMQEEPVLVAALAALQPRPHYLVLVNRSWKRSGGRGAYQAFPCSVREMLPCFPVPLRREQAEVPLDLQYVMNQAYDSGPYRRGAVDYAQAPSSPLEEENAAWADALLRGLRAARG